MNTKLSMLSFYADDSKLYIPMNPDKSYSFDSLRVGTVEEPGTP